MARTRVHVILRPHYTHRIAVVRVEAIAELVDARRDLVKVDGLLAPVPLLDVHGGEGGREGERGGRAENEQTLEKKKKKKCEKQQAERRRLSLSLSTRPCWPLWALFLSLSSLSL